MEEVDFDGARRAPVARYVIRGCEKHLEAGEGKGEPRCWGAPAGCFFARDERGGDQSQDGGIENVWRQDGGQCIDEVICRLSRDTERAIGNNRGAVGEVKKFRVLRDELGFQRLLGWGQRTQSRQSVEDDVGVGLEAAVGEGEDVRGLKVGGD